MKKLFKSKTLIAALLCSVTSLFGVGAPALAGNEAPPVLADGEAATSMLTDDNPFVPPDLLRNEVEAMQRFATPLIEYMNRFGAVTGAVRPDPKRITEVETKLNDQRSRFPEFQRNAQAVVTKLKNANKWTDELDAFFEVAAKRKNAPSEFIAFVKNRGGFRRVFEKSVSSFHLVSSQFEDDEASLKEARSRKVSLLNWANSFVVSSAYAPPKLNIPCNYCIALIPTLAVCVYVPNLACINEVIQICLDEHCTSTLSAGLTTFKKGAMLTREALSNPRRGA